MKYSISSQREERHVYNDDYSQIIDTTYNYNALLLTRYTPLETVTLNYFNLWDEVATSVIFPSSASRYEWNLRWKILKN
jgi:hypothetical protein